MLNVDQFLSKELLINFVENNPSNIVVFNPERKIVYLNQAAQRLTGKKLEDIVGHSDNALFPPEVREQYLPTIKHVQESGQAAAVEITLSLKEKVSSYKVDFIPASSAEGNLPYVFAYLNDISEQKKKEQEMHAECQRCYHLIEHVPVGLGVAQTKIDGTILYANNEYLNIYEYESVEELKKHNAQELYKNKDDRKKLIEKIRQQQGYIRDYEIEIKTKTGKIKTMVFAAFRHKDEINKVIIDITERKKLEVALREKEEQSRELAQELAIEHKKLSAVIDNLPIGVGISDTEGKTLSLNKAGLEAFGFGSFDEMYTDIKKYLAEFELYYPDGRVMPVEEWPASRAIRGEYVKNYELVLRRKSISHERILSFSVVPLQNDKGKIDLLVFMIADLTERKISEKALQESEERFRTLADNISQFAWMADETGYIFWYNKRWYEYTGTTPEEMKGWGWQKVSHPDHVHRVVEKISRSFKTGMYWEDTFPLRHKSGHYRWFLSRAIPIRNERGEVVRWFGTNTDITNQIKIEEDLRKSEQKYRTIFEGSNDPITVLDLEQVKYLDVNSRYCDLTGFSKEEILSMKIGSMITPEHLKPELDDIFRRIRAEKELIYDWEIRQRTTGEVIPVQVSSRVVELEGKLLVFSIFRDIRAIKEAEEVLKRDNETLERLVRERTNALLRAKNLSQIGTLASTIAHELRNPLAAIQLGAYNIGRKTTEKEKIDKHLQTIEKKVAESNRFIDDLLHFVRVKPPELKLSDLCELILDSEKIAKGKYQKRGIRIVDNTPHIKDVYIKCDPVQMQEVFSNILNNAFEALGEEGRIEITIIPEENIVKIIIQDNGPGMPPEVIDKLFEPFISTKSKGTGLGLAISKQIIENHNGIITIDSEKGKGTTVTIAMPK